MKRNITLVGYSLLAVMMLITACSSDELPAELSATEASTEAKYAEILQLEMDDILLPSLNVEIPQMELPERLTVGTKHEIVAELQERLMELGFMDNDEPTDYFGSVTQEAVKIYQRQNDLDQDGIVGKETLASILDENAKYYAASNGDSGNDISRIQQRLYELGYLALETDITGNFGDKTEAAVRSMQQRNNLVEDGAVGMETLNLLYSDEIVANTLTYGDESDVVLAAQNRLYELGYLTSTPDGKFGSGTVTAIKEFQSRNDLIVDGYLGPGTRQVLNSSEAQAFALTIGDRSDTVTNVQQLLVKYGYLKNSNVTGYYGEITERAVRLLQRTNGLSVDGMVGSKTMALLTGSSVKRAPANSSSSGSSSGGSGSSSSGGSSSGSSPAPATNQSGVAGLLAIAQSKLGCPYVYGSKGPSSFDCSGFVYWCLNQVGVKQSYLTSSGWKNASKYTRISNFDDLQAGDIVVVTRHVGICAGGGMVYDASASNGKVVYRSMSSWWRRNFIVGWRIF